MSEKKWQEKSRELSRLSFGDRKKSIMIFPLLTFRKHVYQEQSRQLAASFWQPKRNQNARKQFEEVELVVKEWDQAQLNMSIDALAPEVENINPK